jgi:hypothetical protein
MSRTRILHLYVPYYAVEDWMRCGWIVIHSNCPASNLYCVSMEWLCDCKVPKPKRGEI